MENKKNDCTVKGVSCDVHNCAYNDTKCNSCTAPHIDVHNRAAVSKGETFCNTFTTKTSF